MVVIPFDPCGGTEGWCRLLVMMELGGNRCVFRQQNVLVEHKPCPVLANLGNLVALASRFSHGVDIVLTRCNNRVKTP